MSIHRIAFFLLRKRVFWVIAGLLLCGPGGATAETGENSAETLRAKYDQIAPQLSNTPFKRPLYLDSAEASNQLKGDIYAVINHPISAMSNALARPENWCDVLILHLNTKYCHVASSQAGPIISVHIGKKTYEELDQTHPVDFLYSVKAPTSDYFDSRLIATTGPMGTYDYRIRLEALPLNEAQTFLHLTYSYRYDRMGKLAMQFYLATVGHGKVGFTQTSNPPHFPPDYIDGVRGVVERNTMRYYLAIDAYLSARTAVPSSQFETRLQNWFSSTELYARQLHEVTQDEYVSMKRKEYSRMKQTP